MKAKSKGTNAERELIHLLWERGFAAIRVAGSGSIKYPVPDVLASNGTKTIAIEAKATREKGKYLEKREVHELLEFCEKFGALAFVGIKFNNCKWKFFLPSELNEKGKSYMISKEEALEKGKELEEII